MLNVIDNYAVRNGSCVNVRCVFVVGTHTGGNSYIDMQILPFGTTCRGEHGIWWDESGDEAGVLKGSLNHNMWLTNPSTGANMSLASKQGHTIFINYTYYLE